MTRLSSAEHERTLDLAFRQARTQNGWLDSPVSDEQLRALYDLMKWGPTSANCSPARLIFVRTPAAKEQLAARVNPGNRDKVLQAPVTVIIGQDHAFYDKLPYLFPHRPQARNAFIGETNAAAAQQTALRNSSLQGAYLIVAARLLGLDCGPMSGFNAAAVDEAFWSGTTVRTNFICALGKGDPAKVLNRLPRLTFDEACALK